MKLQIKKIKMKRMTS